MSGVTAPRGFLCAATCCGIKVNAKQADLTLVVSEGPALAAAVFTRNRVKAAPVRLSQRVARRGTGVRAVLLNSGNANACTGAAGARAAKQSAAAVAQHIGCAADGVLVASTGVIGVALPVDRLLAGVPALVKRLRRGARADRAAAQAIMTTDTRPKLTQASVRVSGRTYTVGGMAKGSGMIHPDMATMLGVITCDAPLTLTQARLALRAAVAESFNCISVDGDTSTNDCVFFLANGMGGGRANRAVAAAVGEALTEVCRRLAEAIAIDGEGATRLIEVQVLGARSIHAARRIARTVISSPLVKTAVAGGDANWGRVIAAAGRAGVPLREAALALAIGNVPVVRDGLEVAGSQARALAAMRGKKVCMTLTVGQGHATATALGCDLTHGYIDINAHYRT